MLHFLNKRDESTQKEETRNLTVLPYYPGLNERLIRCLRSHNIKVVSKPTRKIGDILGSTKDSVNKNLRQGVIYSIPCPACQQCYIGKNNVQCYIGKNVILGKTNDISRL